MYLHFFFLHQQRCSLNKLIFAFPLALIGAIFFAAQPLFLIGSATVGLAVSVLVGIAVYLFGSRGHKKAQCQNCDNSAYRASCVSVCGMALISAGIMGNVYLVAPAGGIAMFLVFLLCTGLTALLAAAGFFGYRKGPNE